MSRLRRDDAGIIAVIVAIFAVALFMLAAMVVEVGSAREARRAAQAAADSAALAAAGVLYSDTGALQPGAALNAARRYARDNYNNGASLSEYWNNCPTWAALPDPEPNGDWSTSVGPVSSGTPCLGFFRENSGQYTKVYVMVPGKDTPGFFGAVQNDITGVAQAEVEDTTGFLVPCVLCVLGDFTGNVANVAINDGDARIDNLTFAPTGRMTVTNGFALYNTWDTNGAITPTPVQGGPVLDPFAGLNLPPSGTDFTRRARIAPSGPCSQGNYRSGIDRCTSFQPGIYVITGGSVALNNSTPANNVLFYLTCSQGTGTNTRPRSCDDSSSSAGAAFVGAGSQDSTITGRRVAGDYQGFAVIVDPDNTSTHSLVGAGDLTVHGAVYMPNGDVDDGTATSTGTYTGFGPVVVVNMTLNGDSLTPRMTHNAEDTVRVTRTVSGGIHLIR